MTYAIATRPPRRIAPRVLSNAGRTGGMPEGGPGVGEELDILSQRSEEDRTHENQEPWGDLVVSPRNFMRKSWVQTVKFERLASSLRQQDVRLIKPKLSVN